MQPNTSNQLSIIKSSSIIVKSLGNKDLFSLLSNYFIAGVVVALVSIYFFVINADICDWFIVPAIFCGVLMGADVVSWLRGQIDLFDPKGLIGLVVFLGFFLAPILHVYWNNYAPDLRFHGDPRYWLLVATTANAVGLPFYKAAQHWAYRQARPVQTTWKILPQRILPILACVLPIALGTWLYFERLNWQSGVVDDFIASQAAMQGSGWLLVFGGEFLGVLLVLALISFTMAPRMDRSWWACTGILVVGVAAQLFFTVYSGVRGLILQGIFWIAGLIHYYWRRLGLIYLFIGLFCFLPFMYIYGLYKDYMQPTMLTSLKIFSQTKDLERETGRDIYSVLLGDLSRADVQARIAIKVIGTESDYELRYGRTYLFAFSKLIPNTIRNLFSKDPTLIAWSKGKAFIDLNEGKGSFDAQTNWGTNAFGLGGEAMLNFGLIGVPVAWLLFGLILGVFRRKRDSLAMHDTRWALVPFLSYWLALTPVWDLDVIVFQVVRGGFIFFLCIFCWSRKIKQGKGSGKLSTAGK